MGRFAPAGVKMGQSSCGNSARAVTACGKIREASLKELHAYEASSRRVHGTHPQLSIY